jgi:hypothetical protein
MANPSAAMTRSCPNNDGAKVTIQADYSPFFISLIPGIDDFTLQGQAVMRCGG